MTRMGMRLQGRFLNTPVLVYPTGLRELDAQVRYCVSNSSCQEEANDIFYPGCAARNIDISVANDGTWADATGHVNSPVYVDMAFTGESKASI